MSVIVFIIVTAFGKSSLTCSTAVSIKASPPFYFLKSRLVLSTLTAIGTQPGGHVARSDAGDNLAGWRDKTCLQRRRLSREKPFLQFRTTPVSRAVPSAPRNSRLLWAQTTKESLSWPTKLYSSIPGLHSPHCPQRPTSNDQEKVRTYRDLSAECACQNLTTGLLCHGIHCINPTSGSEYRMCLKSIA